ncbi:Type IV pilus inner membrane component PilP [Gammaproteobacteria bacterium]
MNRQIYSIFAWWSRFLRQRRNLGMLLVAAMALTGCGGEDTSDLQAFIAQVKARPRPRVEPLPEIRPYETFLYAAGELRNPFEPIVEPQPAAPQEPSKPTSVIHPDFNRHREALEGYPLDSLRMVGTLEQQGKRWGVVRNPDGMVSLVQVGNFMGQNHGHIDQITEDRMTLTEIVTDGADGWQNRQAALTLSE